MCASKTNKLPTKRRINVPISSIRNFKVVCFIEKFKKEYEQGDYESAISTLMDNISAKVIFKFLMNPMNRLKKKLS